MGVHYPTDVIGGFALGTAVVLLLSPLAMALLTPVTRAAERSARAGWVIRARGTSPDEDDDEGEEQVISGAGADVEADDAEQRDLAA
jgi:undecaprenyl-diphosphatase